MATRLDAPHMLDREFLEIRSRLIDIAASLDRIECSPDPGTVLKDVRIAQIAEAARLVADGCPDRAKRVQMIFSDSYDTHWMGTHDATNVR